MTTAGQHARRLQSWIYQILRGGVILSGTVLVVGLVLVLAGHQPRPEAAPPAAGQLLWQAVHGDGAAVIGAGLLLLMLTPLARVAVLAIGWMLGGQRRFALAAAVVLALLVLSLLLGVG